MLEDRTNWPRLYALAVLLGAGLGLFLSLAAPLSAPDWPGQWAEGQSSRVLTIVVPVAGGALVGLVLAAASHAGVLLQLRRRSKKL
jgi:hypothetical protein